MNRRIVTLIAALAPIVVLGVLGTVVQVPFVALGPGPTFDTLGTVGDREVVDIQGIDVDEVSGHLNMTTVAVRDNLNVFEAFGMWASGRHGLVPREQVYPPEKSKEEVQQENDADFRRSEDAAELAALGFLGEPVLLTVGQVGEDGPSSGLLVEGDQILAVEGQAVTTVVDVQQAVADAGPGTSIVVDVLREGEPLAVEVRLGARPDDESRGYLGVTPEQVPDVPFTIDFNLADIGGPSAGLMFSLAVIDKLTPGALNGGDFVAGTGTIDPAGDVGPIGGIRYKLIAAREAGAETFLVPSKNCDEARQGAPDGLRLVRVETLTGAVEALDSLSAGGDAPSC
ncbi:PDZ domain-containing protein [Rhodococcus triatomae]|uniref:YlbL family protein n=1 Tax=Rhodococcus triatomae TaxID=300028 RepID=UPI00093216B2|nr:PDZ domain-containing protein [Rhodococcus triatomae]QNG19378.1 PDZ domain-containing protein [Rhodococcus triatomae]QNG24709.1 PDZ domain-containing protein [Rhodococcus triatomae]